MVALSLLGLQPINYLLPHCLICANEKISDSTLHIPMEVISGSESIGKKVWQIISSMGETKNLKLLEHLTRLITVEKSIVRN